MGISAADLTAVAMVLIGIGALLFGLGVFFWGVRQLFGARRELRAEQASSMRTGAPLTAR